MEFFLQPIETDPRFFNFEWNPNGCSFIGIETNSHDLIRLCPMNEKKLFQPWTARTSDGWTLEYRVPHEFVRMFFPAYHPASGGTVRANCYKCGDLTVQPHYMAWGPVRKSATSASCGLIDSARMGVIPRGDDSHFGVSWCPRRVDRRVLP